MSLFTRSLTDTADEMPEKIIDPKWNHPVSSGDIHALQAGLNLRLRKIERYLQTQLALILLGAIALIATRFI